MIELENERSKRSKWHWLAEWSLLMSLMLVYAGDAPPMVNEAHYLVKAKNFWQPDWCSGDLFASSGKAHVFFYWLLGWPIKYFSLETTAWIGRVVGWSVLAAGLMRLCHVFSARHTASVFVLTLWIAGVEYGNLAGEWVVGGIEGKVPAYGFVLAAIAELARRNWNRVWVLLGIASAFHVLTGGWSVVAAMFAWTITEVPQNRNRHQRYPLFTRWLLLGGVISLAGVVPAAELMIGSSPADAAAAANIYSFFRIRHHLLPSDFLTWWYIRHAIVIGILVAFAAHRCLATHRSFDDHCFDDHCFDDHCGEQHQTEHRFLAFVCGAFGIAFFGLLIGLSASTFPDTAARLLRYYWFRLSDAVIPLGMALMVVGTLRDANKKWRVAANCLLACACLLVGYTSIDRMLQRVPPSVNNRLLGWDADANATAKNLAFQDWLAVCNWAALSTPEDEVFLTPRHQQTFKWYSGRSEVVNWKDVPQDAVNLIEWKKRILEIYPNHLGGTRVTINYRTLRYFRKRYRVRYMIVDRRVVGESLPLLRVYPTDSIDNASYAVYELPR